MGRKKTREFELEVAAAVIADILRASASGQDKSLKSRELCSMFEQRTGSKLTEIQFREVVHHIRVTGLLFGLCASSHGYWVEDSRDAVLWYAKALRGRAESIMEAAVALERQARCLSEERSSSKFEQLSLFPTHIA